MGALKHWFERWRDVLALVFVIVTFALLWRLFEQIHSVQNSGGPPAVCLREALKAAEPLLVRAPRVDAPLEAYVRLQSHRYRGVRCPAT